jgi:hypothetical protein
MKYTMSFVVKTFLTVSILLGLGCTTPHVAPPTAELIIMKNGVVAAPWLPYITSSANTVPDPIPNHPKKSMSMGVLNHISKIRVSPGQIDVADDGKKIRWSGSAALLIKAKGGSDFSPWLSAGGALMFDVVTEQVPTDAVMIQMHCRWPCVGGVDIANILKTSVGKKRTIKIPLTCFAKAGAKFDYIDVPWSVYSANTFIGTFGNIRWVPGAANDADAVGC